MPELSKVDAAFQELLAHHENFVSTSEDDEFEDWDADGEEPLSAETGGLMPDRYSATFILLTFITQGAF